MKLVTKIFSLCLILSFLIACNQKIDQNSMFNGRSHKTKKKGIYDAGLNTKKPISVQTAEDIKKQEDKEGNVNSKKEMKKKKKMAEKARKKHNRKTHTKVKTTKGTTGSDDK